MNSKENLIYTDAEIVERIKENLIRMLVDRGFINMNNIDKKVKEILNINKEEFVLKLDNNENYNTIIENGEILIKFFNYNISSTAKGSEIHEFILKNNNYYKIIIAKEINNKSKKNMNMITNFENPENIKQIKNGLEIFNFFELSFIVIDNISQPKFIPLTTDETKQFLTEYYTVKKKNLSIMNVEEDPVAHYYNLKKTNIVKIIRTTENGLSFSYRIVL